MLLNRSLAISLAIVLAITKSQARGFAIRKAEIWDSTTDLDTGESSILEVRYDLKGATAVKALDTRQTKDETPIAINDFRKGGTNFNFNNDTSNDTVTVTTAIQVTDDETTQQELDEFSKDEFSTTHSSVDLNTTTVEIEQKLNDSHSTSANKSTISNETLDSIESTSTSPMIIDNSTQQNDQNDSTTTEIMTDLTSIYHTNGIIADVSTSNNYNGDITPIKNIDVTEATHSPKSNDTQENTDIYDGSTVTTNYMTTEVDNIVAGNENDASRSRSEKNKTSSDSLPHIIESTSKKVEVEITTELNTITYTSQYSDQTISSINTELNLETTTDNSEVTTTNITTEATDAYLDNNSSVTTEFPTEETFNTETPKDDITTIPSWKVYKTIFRTRPTTTSSEETTVSDLVMTKSESARISLERVLNNTPIPSLEKLKNDLLNAQEYSTITFNTPDLLETIDSQTTVLEMSSSTPQSAKAVVTQTTKLEIVSSKRAGYLDNKATTTVEPPQLATAVLYEDKEVSNDTENFGTMYESEIGELHVNSTGVESQSQLVEDAMKEELLMEKTLNENKLLKENALQRDVPRPLLGEGHPPQDDISTTPEIITEDLLSVKPISPDKRKNNSIYVTSSVNYKPLKKLDVQPAKQFVRDPDDNSWRNESISSLGIVFKPKNASKSFTEVLKNKTTELSNMVEKGDKSDIPDLRIRLEKIAEVRKSKKKRINKLGETVYSDYEENSSENGNVSKEDTTTSIPPTKLEPTSATPSPPSKPETDLTVNSIWKGKMSIFQEDGTTTEKLKKFYNLADYYDATDDYDADYVTLSKIDLKRFTVPLQTIKDPYSSTRPDAYTTPPTLPPTKSMRVTYMPDRQPTIQYFPPTKKVTTPVTPTVNVNDYDDRFNKKLNMFAYKDTPKVGYDVTFATASPIRTKKLEQPAIITAKPVFTPPYQPDDMGKNVYLTSRPRFTEPEPQGGFVPNDGTFNRASYVIKHYKDFINDAAKANDDDKTEYLPYTEPPLRGVTMSEIPNFTIQKETKTTDDYDYDTHFRKDIMTRFVDNFNQNSERFKVDFPILYNNSVVHRKEEENGKVLASSSAFMKRLYETANPRSQFLSNVKPCNGNCEQLTVDLSPAYELHYYVPDQEEKEEIETRANTLPYRNYRL